MERSYLLRREPSASAADPKRSQVWRLGRSWLREIFPNARIVVMRVSIFIFEKEGGENVYAHQRMWESQSDLKKALSQRITTHHVSFPVLITGKTYVDRKIKLGARVDWGEGDQCREQRGWAG